MSLVPISAPPDLAKYKLLDEIGHGGMATVYRALDLRLGREVAVKLIHPHLRENPEAAARFITEARAVAKLRHPGIVEIYDISDEGDAERYLVAELIRGPSLRKLLRERGALPPEIGACIGVLLCDALAHAHDANVVHRDVKPENVLIELDDTAKIASVKLTDFGIAKIIDAQGVTSTGQVLGSPAHMAPEQIEGGPIDIRADIFGVGVLLYECMVGHLPFDGKNPAQVLRRVLDGSYSPADDERPAVGAQWSAIISKAIAREPSDRFQDVRELASEIRAQLAQVGIDDPLSEVYRFLGDPEAFERTFAPKLVGMLVARAERARAAGNIPAAAADLNRAVAYAPDDAELLRRVTALARGQRRQRLVRHLSLMLVPVALLGIGAWAVVLAIRARTNTAASTDTVPPPVASATTPAPPPIVADLSSAVAVHSAPSETSSAPMPPRIVPLPKLHQDAVTPQVRVNANNKAALFSIDGAAPQAVGFGKSVRLAVGAHTVTFSVPKGDPCCDAVSINIDVKPSNEGDPPQEIFGRLAFRDARVSLAAPMGSKMICSRLDGEVRAGAQVAVKMTDATDRMPCFLYGTGVAGEEMPVVLRAGELSVVPWPRP